MNITEEYFGKTEDAQQVKIYSLTNDLGMEVRITNYGGIIQSLTAPDRNGSFEDVVLGYDNLKSYKEATPYFGAIIGRFANRIANGKFNLNGIDYKLAQNDGEQHLHGGIKGFDKVLWDATSSKKDNEISLKLNYISKDGEEGYPGNLNVTVTYSLTNQNEIKIEYTAATDKITHVNLTNHSYFNLSSNFTKSILDHQVWINADKYVPIDGLAIPFGKLEPVEGTPFDFRVPKKIINVLDESHEQIINGNGFDHFMVFTNYDNRLRLQATVYDEQTGRLMEVYTEEPGAQLYIGNYLDGSNIGKGKVAYNYRTGLCIETGHFPDTPNQSKFLTTILNPGETYSTQTTYKFKTINR